VDLAGEMTRHAMLFASVRASTIAGVKAQLDYLKIILEGAAAGDDSSWKMVGSSIVALVAFYRSWLSDRDLRRGRAGVVHPQPAPGPP
jgi:hypothetical protein